MRILIVTDAWFPQTNGVVRTLEASEKELLAAGHAVRIVGPDLTRRACFRLPFYTEIVLEFLAAPRLRKALEEFRPEAVHISTEGPLGCTMRRLCLKKGRSFTTAYHTRFPEYIAARSPRFLRGVVEGFVYDWLRRFHAPAKAVMVATKTIEKSLIAHGFWNLKAWSRGVNTDLFRPLGKEFGAYENLPRPILLYVGRVAVEKNLGAFLNLRTNGSKIVVGSGPDLKKLAAKHPQAHFLGRLESGRLARAYAAADLFVFPSKTDTFGLVLLEACASGLRVAAYPVSGPIDILGGQEAKAFAVLDEDLQKAVDKALALPDTVLLPRAFAEAHSWTASAAQFYENLCSSGV